MYVEFIMKAECRADNIEIKCCAEEIAKSLEDILAYEGITAVVKVSRLTYKEE